MASPDIETFKQSIQTLELSKKYQLRTDPAFLARFLATAKNDQKKALSRYNNYYQTLLNLPEAEKIINKDHKEFVQSLFNWMMDLKKRDVESSNMNYYGQDVNGRHILAFQGSFIDKFMEGRQDFVYAAYGTVLLLELILRKVEEGNSQEVTGPDLTKNCKNEFIVLEDQGGFSLKALSTMQSNRWFIKTLSSLLIGSAPIRLQKILMFNANKFFRALYAIIKVFLPKKMKDRVEFIGYDLDRVVDITGGFDFTPVIFEGGKLTRVDFGDDVDKLEDLILEVFPSTKLC